MSLMFTLLVLVYSGTVHVLAQKLAPENDSNKLYKGDNEYGYVEVRPGAFLFWWLYYAGGDKNTAFEKPFIIWIQGGPGNPASAFGNYMEIGPQDMFYENRSLSWVHKRNVLFIDSPVGTGFSYYTDPSLLVTTDEQLVDDLLELIRQFLEIYPKFETVPTHIFSQSYGAKIAPRLAYLIHLRVKAGTMKMNLKSLGLGSSIVSPRDCVGIYHEYLFILGYIDQADYEILESYSQEMRDACDKGFYYKANELRIEMITHIPDTLNVNFYNVLNFNYYDPYIDVEYFINNTVKPKIANIFPQNISYGFNNRAVKDAMLNYTMVPSVDMVENLLNETNITIVAYNGNWDSITPIKGALKWLHRLNWHGAEEFRKAPRQRIRGTGNGHYKTHDRLSFWWIYKAGHSVGDNLEAMDHLLDVVIGPGGISWLTKTIIRLHKYEILSSGPEKLNVKFNLDEDFKTLNTTAIRKTPRNRKSPPQENIIPTIDLAYHDPILIKINEFM